MKIYHARRLSLARGFDTTSHRDQSKSRRVKQNVNTGKVTALKGSRAVDCPDWNALHRLYRTLDSRPLVNRSTSHQPKLRTRAD
eukprot:1374607-Amorphochlora_amoeboformis.AAC.2